MSSFHALLLCATACLLPTSHALPLPFPTTLRGTTTPATPPCEEERIFPLSYTRPEAPHPPLPCTHENASTTLRVEREGPACNLPTADYPCYRYTMKRLHNTPDSPGSEQPAAETFSFTSERAYGHAYACGNLLLLSNTCTEGEGEEMFLAIIDFTRGSVMEDELLPDPEVRQLEGLNLSPTMLCWDAVDDQGKLCGGQFSYLNWHRMDAVKGTPRGLSVRLGAKPDRPSPIIWSYHAASGKSHLRRLTAAEVLLPTLPHHCRTFRLKNDTSDQQIMMSE